MEEKFGRMEININGENYEATPHNAILYRFIGHLAIYDHVFITKNEDNEELASGAYAFLKSIEPDGKSQIQQFMVDNGYSCYLNLREISELDINAFDDVYVKPALNDIDRIPDEWQ